MIYITKFKDNEEYNSLKNKLKPPNISVALEEHDVYYNPYIESEESSGSGSGSGCEGGSSEPALEGNKILCKYNITNSDVSLPRELYHQESSGSGSGSGSGNTPMFSLMIVDGVEQEVTNSYTFYTTGEHTVLFTLPEGVTSIGERAFYECSGLTSVIIGNSVTSIDNEAFSHCSGLTSITIPDSVTYIGSYAFRCCSGLTSISIATNNQTYDSRNNCNAIIETSTNKLILGCKNTIIPDSVTSIGNSAFYNCSGLTSITIPDSVTYIGSYAFKCCSGLTSITIPDSVTTISEEVFFLCTELTSVTIGNSVTSIDRWVFNGCSKLISIICNAITAPNIQSSTFQGIKSGGTLTVPVGSTGYDIWMGTGNYYLGYYNWNKVEQSNSGSGSGSGSSSNEQEHDYVEIAGIKWATMNLGANSVTDTGLYYQWGDTQGYTEEQIGNGSGQKYFSESDYKYYDNESYTKYNDEDGLVTLLPEDDAVTVAWGGNWRMPTESECELLAESTNMNYISDYQGSGISGYTFTDKTDSSKVLFFPLNKLIYTADDIRSSKTAGPNGNPAGFIWTSSLASGRYSVSDAQDFPHVYFAYGTYRFEGRGIRGILDNSDSKISSGSGSGSGSGS